MFPLKRAGGAVNQCGTFDEWPSELPNRNHTWYAVGFGECLIDKKDSN